MPDGISVISLPTSSPPTFQVRPVMVKLQILFILVKSRQVI